MKHLITRIWERLASQHRDESGSTFPFYIIFFVLSISVIGIGVDFGTAMLVHEARNNDLAVAKNLVESDAYALLIKNAEDPAVMMSKLVNQSLRDSGFEGEADVYIYECSKEDIENACKAETGTTQKDKSNSRRVIGWLAVAREDVPTPFMSGFGMPPITVQSVIAGTVMPYSGGETWRPLSTGGTPYPRGDRPNYNGIYQFSAGSNRTASPTQFSQINHAYSASEWPHTLQSALEKRLDKIAKEKSDNFSGIDSIWTDN